MGIIYWREDMGDFVTARTMQDVAIERSLWDLYAAFGSPGREVFRSCAGEDHSWLLDTVLAYAAYMENPTPPPRPVAPPTSSTPARTFVRGRDKPEDTRQSDFAKWMGEVTLAVRGDKTLAYSIGDRRVLKDGTVAVSVAVHRGKHFLQKVSFVFHYHPGAQGARVGATAGSKWHFKPFDGAQKYVRVEEHDFGKLDADMVRKVKDVARRRG